MKRSAIRAVFLPIVAACVIALANPIAARANCGDTFTIYNQGYHTMYAVYVEPSSYGYWGSDLLGSGYVLHPGHSFQPLAWHYGSEPYYPSVYHDVRVVYDDGSVRDSMGVDICAYNVSFSY